MIASELLRLRFSLVTRIIGILVVSEGIFIGLLITLLPSITDGLIALNDVIPNATDADQLDPSQLAALGLDSPATQEVIIDLLSNSGTGTSFPAIAALLLGALTIATEHRRGSIVTASLAEPRRAKLLLAKMSALALTVSAGALVLIMVRGLMLTIGLTLQGAPLHLSSFAIAALWARDALALVFYAILGFAIGLLVRSPVTALILLGAAIVVESVIRPITLLLVGSPNPADFLPFGLVRDISGTNPLAALTGATVATTGFTPVTALLVLAAWTISAAAVASGRFGGTDIPNDL